MSTRWILEPSSKIVGEDLAQPAWAQIRTIDKSKFSEKYNRSGNQNQDSKSVDTLVRVEMEGVILDKASRTHKTTEKTEPQEMHGLATVPKPRVCLPNNLDSEALQPDEGWMLRKLLRAGTDTLAASNDLGKATRQLALCTRAMVCMCKRTDHCIIDSRGGNALDPVSAAEFQLARNLQFLCSAPESIAVINQRELNTHGAYLKQGEVWMQGRGYSAALAASLDITALRIIMPTTRLAYLLMTQAHAENHQSKPRDTMARTRHDCWIPQAQSLAQRVIWDCLT